MLVLIWNKRTRQQLFVSFHYYHCN